MQDPLALIYRSIGSNEPYYRLVEEFYKGVENDPVLRPLYPEDLSDAKRHLALFLIQRTGGESTYSQQRGHPRMRQRHMPFSIGLIERNAWLVNMDAALSKVDEFACHRQVLSDFFASFATFLINKPESLQPVERKEPT
jgi:hemoglobin